MSHHASDPPSKKPDPSKQALAALDPRAPTQTFGNRRSKDKPTNRPTNNVHSMTPQDVLALQRMVGNQTVQRMLQRAPVPQAQLTLPTNGNGLIQRKRTISTQAGHIHETKKNSEEEETEALQEDVAGAQQDLSGMPDPSDDGSENAQEQLVAPNPLNKKDRRLQAKQIQKEKKLRKKAIKRQLKQIQNGKKVRKYSRFDDIEINDDPRTYVRNINDTVVWYPLQANPKQYVLASKVYASFESPTSGNLDDIDHDQESFGIGDGSDVVSGILNEGDDALVARQRQWAVQDHEGKSISDSETVQERIYKAEAPVWGVAGLAGMGGGILGMASSLRSMTSDESTTWEKVEEAFNLLSSGSDTIAGGYGLAGGVSSMVNLESTPDSKQEAISGAIGSWSLGYQFMFGTISSGVKSIKDIMSLIKLVIDQAMGKGGDREDWAEKGSSLLINSMETAKGVVSSVRVIWEMLHETVSVALDQVVPAIDIAISAIKTIFQGYYLIRSALRWWKMYMRQRKETKKLKKQSGWRKKEIGEARSFYRDKAGLIANTDLQIGRNKRRIDSKSKKLGKLESKPDSNYKALRKFRGWRQGKLKNSIEISEKKKAKLEQRKGKAQAQIRGYETGQMDKYGQSYPEPYIPQLGIDLYDDEQTTEGQISTLGESWGEEWGNDEGEAWGEEGYEVDNESEQGFGEFGGTLGVLEELSEQEESGPENRETEQLEGTPEIEGEIEDEGSTEPKVNHVKRLDLSEIDVATEITWDNAKRILRQSLHISANLVKIAGSIVTIVGGYGAPAGIALKAAAGLGELSLPVLRGAKRYGRNKSGKAVAKESKSPYKYIFNSNKSNAAKLAHRKKQAVSILMMVADLYDLIPTDQNPTNNALQRANLAARAEHVEDYMRALGVSPKKLYKSNGDPQTQVKLLVEAMYKRELI